MVVWCTHIAPIRQQFHVAPAIPALSAHYFGGYSKTRYKKLVTHVESHASAVGLPENSAIDHSHERGVSLVQVSPLSDWYVFQQRRVHGHFARRTLIFRFKSMGEEKWTAGQGHKGRTCPL